MNDEPKVSPEDAAEEAPRAETGAAEAEAADPVASNETGPKANPDTVAGGPNKDAPKEPSAEELLIGDLQGQVADLKDRLLRAAAEMENIRRRYEREVSDARQYAVTGFAREVLSIGDNLSRALAAVPEEARQESGAIKSLLDGVEMTERELLRVLDKHGVRRIEPHGEKFDPHRHQAIFEVELDSAPHGTVVQVIQPGYTIGERILRPAMVGVAKAAAKKAEPEPSKEPAVSEEPAAKAANES